MCPVLVTVDAGRLVSVTGDTENEVFQGYSCVKGRSQPQYHNHPDRLLTSLKRQPDGSYAPISAADVMDEVAERLDAIVRRHGPRAVAGYFGSMVITNPGAQPTMDAFMRALGSPLQFHPGAIDKPGKPIAAALMGRWQAPAQGYDRPEVALLIGLNPVQSHYGVASGSPTSWLNEQLRGGMQLIVIDPRRTELARRATLHIQPVPGQDVAILAALIHVILAEGCYDRAFVAENVEGVEELRAAVAAFDPATVAAWADVPADALVEAARVFSGAGRGYAAAGVGPGFAESSTLVEYLVLVLESLCGHWLRAGERVPRMPTMLGTPRYVAQAAPPTPAYDFGEHLRSTGLGNTAGGLPLGVLAEEMLHEGEGRVRALLSCGGNPVSAWPDQLRVIDALNGLDLLVQIDPWMSATARLADYVIAPKMCYEVPGATFPTDTVILMSTWYGPAEAYAQYTPAIVDPPHGSDLIEEWEFFYGLAQRLNLDLELSTLVASQMSAWKFDRERKPTTDELIEVLASGGRVPLAEVKRHPHGATFAEPASFVEAPDPNSDARLNVGHPQMLRHLREVGARAASGGEGPGGFGLRLVHRRLQHAYNSTGVELGLDGPRRRPYNPAYLHPDDLAALGLTEGDPVHVVSARASIPAIVAADDTLRPGLVAMSQGFGMGPERDDEYETVGAGTGRLLQISDLADPYIGMPRINNIPVKVTPRLVPFE
jgi:anaerobic selenocysteine-containing dehydrogenase